MKRFLDKIETLIINNRPIDAVILMLNEVNEFQNLKSDYKYEVNSLKVQLLVISSSLNELKANKLTGTLDFDSSNIYRSKQIEAIIGIRDDLENYLEFSKYLTTKYLKKQSNEKLLYDNERPSNENLPAPILYINETKEKEDIEQFSPFVTVSSRMEPEDAVKKIIDLIPNQSLLKKAITSTRIIDNLLNNYKIKNIGSLENANDIKNKLNDYIDSLKNKIRQINEFPENINLDKRAFLPQFYIINKGEKSLLNPLFIIEQNPKIRFVKAEEISTLNISIPSARPTYINELITFIDNLELYINDSTLLERKQDPIEAIGAKRPSLSHMVGGDIVSGDKYVYYSHGNENLLQKFEIKKFKNELRVDYNGSIKREQFVIAENEKFYLLTSLKSGEECYLNYKCYLDNHDDAISNKIKIIGL